MSSASGFDDIQLTAIIPYMDDLAQVDVDGSSSSRVDQPTIVSNLDPSDPEHSQIAGATLAPPPHAPQGPRLPAIASPPSRTPSPVADLHSPPSSSGSGEGEFHSDLEAPDSPDSGSEYEDLGMQEEPSAKALGKRKVVDADEFHCAFEFLQTSPGLTQNFQCHWQRRMHFTNSKMGPILM